MSVARRTAVALAIAGLVVTPITATAQRSSPGYTYRLRTTGRVTEPNGRTTDYVVMSGHAMVTEQAGRLDVDDASWKRGAVAGKDSYILYDSTSLTIVAPRNRQIVRLSLDTLERELSSANTADPRVAITDVAVDFEKLGPGEAMLGLATTRFRITQDYKLAAKTPSVTRSSAEHVVQELWIADEQKGLRNPFARLDVFRAGPGSDVGELLTRTAEARSKMGRGVPLKTVTTSTSTSGRNAVTQTVTTMEVSNLQAENVDDDILAVPEDYHLVAVSELPRTAPSSQGSRAGAPAKAARPAATDGAAAAEAKGGFVKILHGMGRRP
jgi:hypothetical protein